MTRTAPRSSATIATVIVVAATDAALAFANGPRGTREQIFSEDGELNRYVNVYLNDEDVRVLEGLETPASDSDTVVILPAMAGGS